MTAKTTESEVGIDERIYGSPAEIQRRYGLKRTTTYELIWSGQLPSRRVGRSILVRFADVDAYLARQPSAAKTLA